MNDTRKVIPAKEMLDAVISKAQEKDKSLNVQKLIWNGIEIEVKKVLSVKDMLDYIDFVSKSCFSEDGEYTPQLKGYAQKKMTILKYTNIQFSKDIDETFTLIYGTTLVRDIVSIISKDQYLDMNNAVSRIVEYTINNNTKKFEADVEKIVNSMAEMNNDLGSLFGDVKSEDVKNLFTAVKNGQIDEEALVNAYIKNMKRIDTSGTN